MKITKSGVAYASILLFGTASALAGEQYSAPSETQVGALIRVAASAAHARQAARYGYASLATAERSITIDNQTRHINVVRMETIAIRVGEKTVTWTFDTLGTSSFPLSEIIPGTEQVTVYVDENPMYRGGQ